MIGIMEEWNFIVIISNGVNLLLTFLNDFFFQRRNLGIIAKLLQFAASNKLVSLCRIIQTGRIFFSFLKKRSGLFVKRNYLAYQDFSASEAFFVERMREEGRIDVDAMLVACVLSQS